MKNPLTWLVIACIIIGILIACSIWMGYERYTYKKSSEDWHLNYNACMNAPITSDTSHDKIIINGKVWLKPKEVSVFEITIPKEKPILIAIHDTAWDTIPAKLCEKNFAGKYLDIKGKDTSIIYYAIRVKDCNSQVLFPRIELPKEIITKTQHVDTCISKPPMYLAKFLHHGPYIDMTLNNFTSFPGVGIGYQLIFKDQITVAVGGMYMEKPYFNIRLGWLFKK